MLSCYPAVRRRKSSTAAGELFQVLTAGGAETVEHLQKGGFDGLEAILRQFVESSEATRNILSDLPKVNWKIRMEALRRRMKKDSPEE